MEEHFSKYRLTTDIVAIKTNLPAITPPVRKNAPKHIAILNNSFILGIILVLFMLFLLITMIISEQQTKHNTTQSALISQLQIHYLRLATATQQALSGNATAFTQLQNNQHHLNQHITLLSQGGDYRNDTITLIPDHLLSLSLKAYHQSWQLEAKKIDLILSHKESLIKLSNSMKAISITHHQFARRVDELC